MEPSFRFKILVATNIFDGSTVFSSQTRLIANIPWHGYIAFLDYRLLMTTSTSLDVREVRNTCHAFHVSTFLNFQTSKKLWQTSKFRV